jgi:arylformamidase
MPVYKHYDQSQLNHQYNNSELVPHYQQYYDQWVQLNDETVQSFNVIPDLPYGPGLNEKLDFYPAPSKLAPTVIFIHGGYWQVMDRSDFKFIAQAFVPHNIHTAIIGYPLAPVKNMFDIINAVRKALTWIHHNIERLGGDPDKLYIIGHSAGGHLATMMMTREYAPDNIRFMGICSLSGLYDLIPIQLSHVNEPIGMDIDTAIRCSPVRHIPNTTPLYLIVGGDESDEYHAQMMDLSNKWNPYNSNLKLLELPGVNHFSILSELLNSKSTLFKTCKEMIWGG